MHRLFLVIAMYCQASSSQFNQSLNLPHCQLAGHNSKGMQQVAIHQKQPIYYLNFLSVCQEYRIIPLECKILIWGEFINHQVPSVTNFYSQSWNQDNCFETNNPSQQQLWVVQLIFFSLALNCELRYVMVCLQKPILQEHILSIGQCLNLVGFDHCHILGK